MRIPLFTLCMLVATAAHAGNKLQADFDYLGPTMKMVETASGRTVVYLDEGKADWHPVVFVGGSGTSGRVFAMLEFLREAPRRVPEVTATAIEGLPGVDIRACERLAAKAGVGFRRRALGEIA